VALVWGGFEFGEPPEAVLAKLPQSRQSGNTVETGLQSFGAEFDVVFEFDQYGLSAVRLNFIRCLSTTFGRLVSNVVHQITLNSGIGERRHKFDNETKTVPQMSSHLYLIKYLLRYRRDFIGLLLILRRYKLGLQK
jgi:hypothetical protein